MSLLSFFRTMVNITVSPMRSPCIASPFMQTRVRGNKPLVMHHSKHACVSKTTHSGLFDSNPGKKHTPLMGCCPLCTQDALRECCFMTYTLRTRLVLAYVFHELQTNTTRHGKTAINIIWANSKPDESLLHALPCNERNDCSNNGQNTQRTAHAKGHCSCGCKTNRHG